MPRPASRLHLGVHPPEVIDHRAPLLGAQPAQLFPRRLAPATRRGARGIGRTRREQLDARGRRRFTLALVALFTLERPAGVEHPAQQLLLSFLRRLVHPAALERLGEPPRLGGERVGATGAVGVTELLERTRHLSLLSRERSGLRAPRPARARHLEEVRRLAIERALLLRQLLHLLQHVGEAGGGLRGVHALAVADERGGGAGQRVGRVAECILRTSLRRCLRARRLAGRSRTLPPCLGDRGARAAGEERRGAACLLEALARLLHSLLQRALLRPQRARARSRLALFLERALPLRELHHLLDRAIDLAGELRLPGADLLLPRTGERIGGLVHLGGPAALCLRPRGVALLPAVRR